MLSQYLLGNFALVGGKRVVGCGNHQKGNAGKPLIGERVGKMGSEPMTPTLQRPSRTGWIAAPSAST